MICADTSIWIAYLNGEAHEQLEKFEQAMSNNVVCMAPTVLTELLSFPKIEKRDLDLVCRLPRVELKAGYWERVGHTRRTILIKGLKARLADSLIAQSCMDGGLPLLAIDQDYRHFVKFGLKLL